MLYRIARHADDRIWWQKLARRLDWHVCLTDMDPICLDRECDVDSVVDEDGDIVLATYLFRCLGDSQELCKMIA